MTTSTPEDTNGVLFPENYRNAEDFSRAGLSRFIDHMQKRRKITDRQAAKLRKTYVKQSAIYLPAKDVGNVD